MQRAIKTGYGQHAASAARVASLLVLAAASVQAADGPYVGGSYAYGTFETRCDGACDRHDSGFRLEAGWAFAKYWSIEALYLDAGDFLASDVTGDGTPFEGRSKVTAWGGTLGFHWPFSDQFSVGARLGAAAVKAQFTPGPLPALAGGDTSTQPLGGLTAAWHFSRAWTARIDWDHTRGRINRFNGELNVASVGIQFGF